MTRRFVAIGVPAEVREPLAEVTAHLRAPGARLRPADPAGWHLTLAFLGEPDEEAIGPVVDAITDAVAAAAPRPAPRLRVAGAGRFGDRVLLARLEQEPAGAMDPLVADLHERLRDVGLQLPERRFRPHLTLARARRRAPVGPADVAALGLPAISWRPATLDLWRSTAVPGVYEVEVALAWPSSG
ncbi:MAG: RNA 2',3'-cyclic phosphodiesterase [Nitriliruptoraceae bacterium]